MVTCWNLGNSDSFAFIQSNIRTNFYERNPPLLRYQRPDSGQAIALPPCVTARHSLDVEPDEIEAAFSRKTVGWCHSVGCRSRKFWSDLCSSATGPFSSAQAESKLGQSGVALIWKTIRHFVPGGT